MSKVKNATKTEFEGIKFKSKLEAFFYRKALELGLKFAYEPRSYILLEEFEHNGKKVRPMTFTPDFEHHYLPIIVEVKGYANDAFPLRWKLFKWYCKHKLPQVTIHIVKNQKQALELLTQILETYGPDSE